MNLIQNKSFIWLDWRERTWKKDENGHGELMYLLAEYQGFLDCLISLGFMSREVYALYIDEFREKMKKCR